MKNCLRALSICIIYLLLFGGQTSLSAQNVRDGFCDYAVTISCGQTVSNQTTVGATNTLTAYPQCNSYTFSGPERVYKIVTSTAGRIQVDLTIDASYLDLDILLLGNNCSTPTCLAQSITSNANGRTEQIVYDNAPAGTYYVIVDSEKDVGAFSLLVTCNSSPPPPPNNGCVLEYTAKANNISCGGSKGSIDIEIAWGKGPFKIEWDNAGNTVWNSIVTSNKKYTISDLPAGTYTVKITDQGATNCVVMKNNITISNAGGSLNATFSVTDAACGSYFGFINVNVANSSPPYWVTIKGPKSGTAQANSNEIVVKDMPPGQYEVSVEKGNCVKTGWVTVGKGADLDFDAEVTDATCGKKGSFWINVYGGSPTYTIEWWHKDGSSSWMQSSGNSFAMNEMKQGEYTIKITDRNGCWKSKKMNMGGGGKLDFDLESNAASCSTKGSVWVTIKNGSPSYTVEWSGPSGSDWIKTDSKSFAINNLKAGQYTVVITDANNCKNTKYVTVANKGGSLDFALEANASSCGSKGAIWVTIQDGFPTYTIEWWGPGLSKWGQTESKSFQLKDLGAGEYTVKITDKNGCANSKTIWINDDGKGLDFTLETQGVSCSSSGKIWITMNNGTPNYSVDVTGNNGVSRWFSIKEKKSVVTDLPVGYYTVEITDAKGCKGTKYIDIQDKGGKLSYVIETNDAGCGKDGSVWVTIKDGEPKYIIELWGPNNAYFNASTSSKSFQLKELEAGEFTLKITDTKGCSDTKQLWIGGGNSDLSLDLEVNNAGCKDDGKIWVTIKGGWAPYHLSWEGPVWGDVHTNNKGYQIINLKAGTYTVKVKDDSGCTFTKTVTVYGSSSNLKLELEATNATCDHLGSSWVTIKNGEGPYHISWSGPSSGSKNVSSNSFKLDDLYEGTYTVSVKDNKGCTVSGQVKIHKSGGNIDFDLEANYGECGKNGYVWVTINSGNGPYHISWTGPKNGEVASSNSGYQIGNMPAGWYKVKIKDKNGCVSTKDIEMQGGGLFTVDVEQTEAHCEGSGQIWVDIDGGKPPYSINLSGPMVGTTSTNDHKYHFTNVPQGDYTLKVVDDTGCKVTKNIRVTGKTGKVNLTVETNDAECDKKGAAWITVSGGTANYTISWDGPVSGSAAANSDYQIKDLPAGNYTIKATDKHGCHTSKSITINDIGHSLSLSLEANAASCGQKGAIWVTIGDGQAAYYISWDGPTSGSTNINGTSYQIKNLKAGHYTIYLENDHGCYASKKIDIDDKGGNLSVDLNTTSNVACDHDGIVEVSISDGTAPYTIKYEGPTDGEVQTNNNSYQVSGLEPGNYTFYISDKNNCTDSDKVTIYDNGTDLSLDLTPTDAACGGKGKILVDIFGGLPNYKVTYTGPGINKTLTTGNNSVLLTDLPVGEYTVIVEDAIGCTEQFTADINSLGGDISIQLIPKNIVCGKNGAIEVRISGGSGEYEIEWDGPINGKATSNPSTYTIDNLNKTGNYSVVVKDENGCEAKEWIALNSDGDIKFDLSAVDAACSKDGSILVSISSGAPKYTISWAGPSSNNINTNTNSYRINSLKPGTYTITVKDEKGCQANKTIEVEDNGSTLSLSLTNVNTTCDGSNGSITATVSNGQGNYTFSWSGPVSGSKTTSSPTYTIPNLPDGSYTIAVSDKNGCTINKAIQIKAAGNNIGLTAIGKNGGCGQPSSIQVTIANGVPNFKIEWTGPTNGDITTGSNSHTITDLKNGEYIVRITDATGCTKAQAVIIQSSGNNLDFTYETRDAACNANSGAINLTISNGTRPYRISWSGPEKGSSTSADEAVQITNLKAGLYSVTVEDNNDCVITQSIRVNSTNGVNDGINFAYKPGPVTCNGLGDILVTMISGTAPFTVSWEGPESGSRVANANEIKIENLPEGDYEVTVEGAGGCGSITQKVTIENKQEVLDLDGKVTDGVCGAKGSVFLSWTGGTDPYTITWTGPTTGTIAINGLSYVVNDLQTGDYTFKVAGYNGCEGEYTESIDNSGKASNADFSYTVSGRTLTFNNTSSTGTYLWTFGDGNISNQRDPIHTYESNGTYTICLAVGNDCGNDESCQTVTINAVIGDEPSAKVVLSDKSGPKGTVLQLPVRVENCTRLATLSGTILLGNNNVAKVNGISPSAISPVYNETNYSFSYLSNGLGMNINSETILFYINVELVGRVGQSSSIDLSSLPVALELTCTENGFAAPITPEVGRGRVSISNQLAMAGVNGNIKTYWGEGIAQTMVAIEGADHETYPMTSAVGDYSAKEIPMGYEYTLTPSKNTNPSNGLSTFGLFLTQKYILGYQPDEIESPYQVIAMDANCSGSLTTFDLFVMQQMLVGNLTEFPNCSSWVFVDAKHEFPADFNEKNVFPYANSHTMMLDKEEAVVDFVGIKIGDVLGRAIPNDAYQSTVAEDRNLKVMPLNISQQRAQKGEEIALSFSANDFEAVASFQLGLDFDTRKLEFVGFEANQKNALSSAIAGNVRNQLKISWYHPEGKGLSVTEQEALFTIKFKAKEKIGDIINIININNRTFTSELHKQSQDTYRFKLQSTSPIKETAFKVHQNTPNPFLDATTIIIEAPAAQSAEIILHDHFGRTIKTFHQSLQQGKNVVSINRGNLTAGIYYYTVKAGEFADTKRLLVIER